MKKKLSKKQGFQLLVKRYQQGNPRLDSTEMPQKDEDAGSRKRIYRLTRCESHINICIVYEKKIVIDHILY